MSEILNILWQSQYFILFTAVVIEGPIATVVGGFLAAQNIMNFYLAYILVIIGDLTGDCFYYALGRWGRNGVIDKWGKIFGISKEKINQLDDHFIQHSGKTLLLGKLAHGVGTVFLVAAGAGNVSFKKFLGYNLLGTLPKSLILLLIGYFFGQAISRMGRYFDYFALGTLILAVALLLLYFVILKISRNKEKKL